MSTPYGSCRSPWSSKPFTRPPNPRHDHPTKTVRETGYRSAGRATRAYDRWYDTVYLPERYREYRESQAALRRQEEAAAYQDRILREEAWYRETHAGWRAPTPAPRRKPVVYYSPGRVVDIPGVGAERVGAHPGRDPHPDPVTLHSILSGLSKVTGVVAGGIDGVAAGCAVSVIGDAGCSEAAFGVGDGLGLASAGLDAVDQLRARLEGEPVDEAALAYDAGALATFGLSSAASKTLEDGEWSERESMRFKEVIKVGVGGGPDIGGLCHAFSPEGC